MRDDWSFWARPEQRAPEGDWRFWLFLGGRGAGKTRAGAEFVRAGVAAGARRIALVAPTLADVREVMMAGASGLCALGPPALRPRAEPSRRRLVWRCGALAYAFSAEDPDSLRGPQFDLAWGDELAAWAHPDETLAMLDFALRLGDRPRAALTTTPRPIPLVRSLLGDARTAVTRAPTAANAENLSPGFVAALEARYACSALARQELMGELIEDPPGALWTRADMAAARASAGLVPDEIVVAVDPPASVGPAADACGIIAAGACGAGPDRRAVVLADATLQGAEPLVWARRAADLAAALGARRIVAEANQGGELVRSLLLLAGADAPVRLVRAHLGKAQRAAPVAALYAQGRIARAGAFPALQDQMCAFGAAGFSGSPDRVDALVWAIADLFGPQAHPGIRTL